MCAGLSAEFCCCSSKLARFSCPVGDFLHVFGFLWFLSMDFMVVLWDGLTFCYIDAGISYIHAGLSYIPFLRPSSVVPIQYFNCIDHIYMPVYHIGTRYKFLCYCFLILYLCVLNHRYFVMHLHNWHIICSKASSLTYVHSVVSAFFYAYSNMLILWLAFGSWYLFYTCPNIIICRLDGAKEPEPVDLTVA